jgi:hypothetical protein
MRCLNCLAALMETDTICPSCRSAVPRAASQPVMVQRRKGLLEGKTAAFGSMLARVPGLKWVVGLFLFLVAGATILVALGCFFTYQSEGERGPRQVKADELRNLASLDSLSDPWISYTFPASCETAMRLQKTSLTKKQSYSRFLLVQVQDRWLAAQVPPDFTGTKLVGKVERLGSWDGRTFEKDLSSQIINQIKASNPDKANLILPYQVNAVIPYQSRTRSGYALAVGIALAGVIVGSMGLTIVRAKPRQR